MALEMTGLNGANFSWFFQDFQYNQKLAGKRSHGILQQMGYTPAPENTIMLTMSRLISK